MVIKSLLERIELMKPHQWQGKDSLRPAAGIFDYYSYITQMPRTSVKRLLPFVTAPGQSSAPPEFAPLYLSVYGPWVRAHSSFVSHYCFIGLLRVVVLCSASRRSEARRLLYSVNDVVQLHGQDIVYKSTYSGNVS